MTFDISLIRPLSGIFLLSVAVPIGIYFGRNNIRARRRELIVDLKLLFTYAKNEKDEDLIIPSVELVRYKYDPNAKSGSDEEQEKSRRPVYNYAFPVLIYISLTFLGFWVTFIGPDEHPHLNPYILGGYLAENFDKTMQANFYATVCFTFLGSYIWTVFYLLKRVSNFDLSPLSFLRSTAHVLFALFVSSTLWHLAAAAGWKSLLGSAGESAGANIGNMAALTVGLAFLIGFFPDLAVKAITAKYPWMRLKRVAPATKKLCEEIPLDCIIGIDPFIKFRLGDFEIEDVQNLATINPIQLFVESPYTLYEVIDWVAQAQLILAVGSKKALKLRRLGIRTVFDFEKVLSSKVLSDRLLSILLPLSQSTAHDGSSSAMMGSVENAAENSTVIDLPAPSAPVGAGDPNLLGTLITIINEDLHVQRLRQLWDVISMRLDERPKGFSKKGFSRIFPQGLASD